MKISDIRNKLNSQLKEQHPQAVRLICDKKDVAEDIKKFLENVLQNQSTQTAFAVEQDGNQYIVTIAPEVHQASLDVLADVEDDYTLDTPGNIRVLLVQISTTTTQRIIDIFKKYQQLPLEEKQNSSISLKNIFMTLPVLRLIFNQVDETTCGEMIAFLKNKEAFNNLRGSLGDIWRELWEIPVKERWDFFQLVLKILEAHNNLTKVPREEWFATPIGFIAELIDKKHHLKLIQLLEACKGFTTLSWFLKDFSHLFCHIDAAYHGKLISVLESNDITIDTKAVRFEELADAIENLEPYIRDPSPYSPNPYPYPGSMTHYDFFQFLKKKGVFNNLIGSLTALSNAISYLHGEHSTDCVSLLTSREMLKKLTEGGKIGELRYLLRVMVPSDHITTDEKLIGRWNIILLLKETGVLKKLTGKSGEINKFLDSAVPVEKHENFIAELSDEMQCLKLIDDEIKRLETSGSIYIFLKNTIAPKSYADDHYLFRETKIKVLKKLAELIWEKGSAAKGQIRDFLKTKAVKQFDKNDNKTNEEILATPYLTIERWCGVSPASKVFLDKLREKIEATTQLLDTSLIKQAIF